MATIWCANTTAHVNKTKIGKKPTYPKGQRRIGYILANFLNYSSSILFNDTDYLCTMCYQKAVAAFSSLNNAAEAIDLDKDRPNRVTASAAASTISSLTNAGFLFADNHDTSPDTSDEETMDIELQLNKDKSIELLNNILKLVGDLPIRDFRNTNILREKINNAIIVIRRAAEHLYKQSEEKEHLNLNIDSELEITIDDAMELIDNFKHLINVSDNSERIRLLTLVPKKWGRVKITNFFSCSDHQARYSVHLRDTNQILTLPTDLRGNIPFDPIIEKAIFDFFHNDEISRPSPNKRDVLQVKKDPKPIRFMLMTLMEAYQQFIQQNPSMRVGKSKFCSLRPRWIKTTTPHDTCACAYHQNPELLLTALNSVTSSRTELSSLIKVMICENNSIDCYLGDCTNCNTNLPSLFFIEQLKTQGINDDEEITWVTWEKTDKRTELQRHTTSILTLLDKFDSLWDKFLIHHLITIEQRDYIKKIKLESSDKGTAVIQLDFAENFVLFSQTAVQSSFWGQQHATIFTVHVKIGTGHRNIVFISDYLKHTTDFVYQAQIIIVEFIKKWYPNVKRLNYLSDGASQHFKNAKNMLNLTFHVKDFGLPASWTFSATSHGKGPVDGIGATVKCRATRYLLSGTPQQAFLTPEDFFKYTKEVNDHQVMKGGLEPNRPLEVFYIKTSQIENTFKNILEKRWAQLTKSRWIDGIQSKHEFIPVDIGKITCSQISNSDNVETFVLL